MQEQSGPDILGRCTCDHPPPALEQKECRLPRSRTKSSPEVTQASPRLDLYEQVQAFTSQGEAIYTVDAKTSIQARQWMSATKAALPDAPVPVADRFRRMGAAPLRYALMGATGLTRPVHS